MATSTNARAVPLPSSREPIFNIPFVVLAVLALLGLLHALLMFVLPADLSDELVIAFAFIPARYSPGALPPEIPGGTGAAVWSFVTYALVHANLSHLGFNGLWLLAFGPPVARRFGPSRFLVFLAVTAAAGAAAYLALHFGEMVPMIGASAAISGTMAAAMRFVFQRGGPLGFLRSRDDAAYRVPAAPLRTLLRNPRLIAFLLVWFGLNGLFGLPFFSMAGETGNVAWEAHIGGFLTGLLAFSLFDPPLPPPLPPVDGADAQTAERPPDGELV